MRVILREPAFLLGVSSWPVILPAQIGGLWLNAEWRTDQRISIDYHSRYHSMKNLGILLSGRGSNFEAIADNVAAGKLDAKIAVVISNRADAPGIESARQRGLNALVIPSKGKPREQHDREVVTALREREVDLVCLAGYMRLLSPWFVQQFPNRIL